VWPVGILAGQEIPVRSGFSDVDVAVSWFFVLFFLFGRQALSRWC
jgi:hypothetical protein